MISASLRSSTCRLRICGTGGFLSVADILQESASRADGEGQFVGPEALQVESAIWSVNRREALANSKYQGGRFRTDVPPRASVSFPEPSETNSSAGFSRSSSAASASCPSDCDTVKRPAA